MNPKNPNQPNPGTGKDSNRGGAGSGGQAQSQPRGDDRGRGYEQTLQRTPDSEKKTRPGQPQAPLPSSEKTTPGRKPNFGDQEPEDPRHLDIEDLPSKGDLDSESDEEEPEQ